MGRRLKFDARKQKRPSQKASLTENDVKAFSQPAPTVVNDGTQTENEWFSSDKEVQTEAQQTESVAITVGTQTENQCFFVDEEVQTETVAIAVGTQTELDVILQAHQVVRAGNEETTKYCEGIVDEKYTSLIVRYNDIFNDATGKQ